MTEPDEAEASTGDPPEPSAGNAPEPSVLESAGEDIGWSDFEAENNARQALAQLNVPAAALGRWQELVVWLAGTQGIFPPTDLNRVRVVVFAADHGVDGSGAGKSDPSQATTADQVPAPRTVHDHASVFADLAGATVRIVESGAGVGPASGGVNPGYALTAAQVDQAVSAGARVADEEVDAGADLLIAASSGAGTGIVAAAAISVLTNTEPVKVLGFGGELSDREWMRDVMAVRDARRAAIDDRYDVAALLSRIGGTDLAALTGFLLRAAARRTPVLLDDAVVCAAALLAREISPRTVRWWQAAHRSSSTAQRIAVEALQLEPLLDLQLGLDQGVGALVAVPLLRGAVRAVTGLANLDDGAQPAD